MGRSAAFVLSNEDIGGIVPIAQVSGQNGQGLLKAAAATEAPKVTAGPAPEIGGPK